MESPSTLNDALEALQAARADVAALDNLTAEHALVVEALSAEKHRVSELVSALATAEANALALAKELDALKSAEASAAAKANVIVANLGIEPVAIQSEQATVTKSTVDLWAEYNALDIYERNAFYQKHKAVLSK